MSRRTDASSSAEAEGPEATAYEEMLPSALTNIRIYGGQWADYRSHLRRSISAAQSRLTPDDPTFDKCKAAAQENLGLLVIALASPENASPELARQFPLMMMAIRSLEPQDREALRSEYQLAIDCQAAFDAHMPAND